MANEDDLLACLLDVAEAELKSLNRSENANNLQKEVVCQLQSQKAKSLQDIDLFSHDTNEEDSEIKPNNIKERLSSFQAIATDSSDDEALRNLKEKKYNECGQAIKDLIAHKKSIPSSSIRDESKSKNDTLKSWNSKPIPQLQAQVGRVAESLNGSSIAGFDTLFGIHVINPVLSSRALEEKMVGRKVVPILHIANQLKTLNKSDDWVIAGVICGKGITRTSAKGNQFMIWTLSDLKGDIKTVALFLFGGAYEQFWKTQSGSVVGVLNPSILDKKEGGRDEATLSVDNPQKLLILGQSKDLGTCKSTKKNGDKCTAIVNKGECEYCIYHIRKEYQKSSRRSELQANFSGKGLIALRNKVLGKNEVFYAGKSYTSIPAKQSKKLIKKDKDRLQSLSGVTTTSSIKKPALKKAAASFDTFRGQRLKDMDTLRKLKLDSDKSDTDSALSNVEKTNSHEVTVSEAKANAVKILSKLKKNGQDQKQSKPEKELKNLSVSGLQNGQNCQNQGKVVDGSGKKSTVDHELLQKSLDEIVQANFIDLDIDITKSRHIEENCSVTYLNNNKKKDATTSEKSHITSSSTSKKSMVTGLPQTVAISSPQLTNAPSTSQPMSSPVFSKTLLTSMTPSLSNNGNLIDLSKPLERKLSRAKYNALKFIQKNGPLEKRDPNNVKSKGIKRNFDDLNIGGEVANKIQKIQENDHFSERFKKMMEIQSKHTNLVQLRDDEEKEKYFKKQEVREKMEEKMANTYKVECKAVKCLDCNYVNFSAGEKCKAEKHRLIYKNAMKRFFKCGNCGYRVACLDIVPTKTCKNCGDGRWERTTMMKEKNVTSTVSLSIRGGEQKFVNSVVTDANINLMVPDDS